MSQEFPKRFQLSSEPFAQRRVEGIKRALESIQEERPEVLSFTLLGSLVKGNTREDSDIDMHVYIDADKISTQEGTETLIEDRKFDFKTKKGEEFQAGTFHWKELSDEIRAEYLEYIRSKLKAELPELKATQLLHIFPLPLSESILEEMLDELVNSYKKYPQGTDDETFHLGVQEIKRGEAAQKETSFSRYEPNQSLYGMFFLDAGGGIRPYRKFLIDRLYKEGEVGEQIWKNLISSTEGWEQRRNFHDGPSDKRYPRTLGEARKVYG
jgi:predicted nucleotidyltransferase